MSGVLMTPAKTLLAAPTYKTTPTVTLPRTVATSPIAVPLPAPRAAPGLTTNAVTTTTLPAPTPWQYPQGSRLGYKPAPVATSPIAVPLPAPRAAYQTLPTGSSAMISAQAGQLGWQAPKTTDGAVRVTIVPIEEDTEETLTKLFNSNEAAEGVASLKGLKWNNAFFHDSKLIGIAKYDTMANVTSLRSAMDDKFNSQVEENFAGSPTRYTGEAVMSYKGRGKMTDSVAIRVTLWPVKPGCRQEILKLIVDICKGFEGSEFDACIDINAFHFEDTMVSVARYSSMEGMEATNEKMKVVMEPVAKFVTGAPERMVGEIAFAHPKTAFKKKQSKKGCC